MTRLPPLIDFSLTCGGQLAERCEVLVQRMEEWEQEHNVRSRSLKDTDKLNRQLSTLTLVSNLYFNSKDKSQSTFGVPQSKTYYAENRKKLGKNITRSGIVRVLDFLVERGFAEIVSPGRKHPDAKQGIPTQVRGKKSFLEFLDHGDVSCLDIETTHPQVILKSDKKSGKALVDFEQTDTSRDMNDQVTLINKVLLDHWADLEIPHKDLLALQDKGIYLEKTLYTRRRLHRVFNNSSFEYGGRFYGGWWQSIPSKLRHRITINNEPTIELDYSSMHPRMLYAELGEECPIDPYDVGLDPEHRDLVKIAFNALINAKGRIKKFDDPEDGPCFDEKEIGMAWGKFLIKIKTSHPKLEPLFGTGIGLKFQRLDSDIAEATMLHFARKDIPVLPVHDSFIIFEKYEDELRNVMKREFKKKIKTSALIKDTDNFIHQKTPRHKHDVAAGLYPTFTPAMPVGLWQIEWQSRYYSPHDYREYDDRQSLFYSYKRIRRSQKYL